MEHLEGNKLIATFEGRTINNDWVSLYGDNQMHVSALDYHKDWNSLMRIVEKISQQRFEDGDYVFLRTFGMPIEDDDKRLLFMVRFNRFELHSAYTLIEAAYTAVVEFIKWHNENHNLINGKHN